jgi:hypothetical protein
LDPSIDTLLQTLSAKDAADLDRDLMSTGAFSIDQLMELAGLSVSQAGTKLRIDYKRLISDAQQYSSSIHQAKGNTFSWLAALATMVSGHRWKTRELGLVTDTGQQGVMGSLLLGTYGITDIHPLFSTQSGARMNCIRYGYQNRRLRHD